MAQAIAAEPVKTRAAKSFVRRARELHLYLGTFFAPAILFFAFSGAMQTFGLHEHRPGDTYQPPEWMRVLAQLHKKQTAVLPPARPEQANHKEAPKREEVRSAPVKKQGSVATVALKWFVLAMSIGLMLTTGLGVYMAFKFNPGRRLIWVLLALGTALPAAFVFL